MSHTHMTDTQEKTICRIINNWPVASGKITWREIVEAVKKNLKVKFTRQTLDSRESIAIAYQSRKDFIKQRKSRRPLKKSMSLTMALEANEKLEGKVKELEDFNKVLLEQIARWVYNANQQGYNISRLDNPIPKKSSGTRQKGSKK